MSLSTRPSPEATPRPGMSAAVRKSPVAPVFKPEFVRSLRMHPRVAALAALAVFAAIVFYALSQRPVYEAEALVYVEPSSSKVIDDGSSGQFDANKYDSYLQQQMQTSERLDILKAAVHSLPVGVWQGRDESEQQAAQRLQHGLKVERVLNSYQLSFSLKGPTAQGTADTLNAVVAAFLAAGRQDELSTAGGRAQILTEEKNRITAELAAARTEQAALSSSLGMANPGLDEANPYDTQLAGLRTQLAEAREAHDVAAAQLASVSGKDLARTQGLTAAAEELIASDAGLGSMKATISQRRAVLSGQMAGLTPENPIYKQDQTEISALDRTLDGMTTQMRDKAERRLQDKLRTDLARTGDVEARVNAQLASQTYAATSASPKLQRASELTADIQRLMKRYATVDDSLRSVQLETSGPGMAHLALAAVPPVYPVASRRKLMLLAALPIALLCGGFAAVFFRKRDAHVYTERDVEELLGFAPIAVLPAPDDVPDGVTQEYVLRLAGGIESAFRTAGARTFVLTPAGTPVEVETLTTPLAARLRQLGLAVATTTARQMMASSGPTPSMDRFHGSVVEARLEELKQHADLVFIDAPALLTSAETEYLVRCADATILVATSGVTRRGDLLQAALLLERLGVKGVGAVLEGMHLRFADAAYRMAVTDLDRRQSFEHRSVRTLEEVGQPAPVTPMPGRSGEKRGRAEAMQPEGIVSAAPFFSQRAPQQASERASDEATQRVAETVDREGAGGEAGQAGPPLEVMEIDKPGAEENRETPPSKRNSVEGLRAYDEGMEPPTQEPTHAAPEIETPNAPANRTGEPLPKAMQYLETEQPDGSLQPEAGAALSETPVTLAEAVEGRSFPAGGSDRADRKTQTLPSGHRRVPARRVQPGPEPARSWFQRIFQREAEPLVSILPEAETEAEHELDLPASRGPAFAQEDLDLPATGEPVTTAAVEPEALPSNMEAAEIVPAQEIEPANAKQEPPRAGPSAGQPPVEVEEYVPVVALPCDSANEVFQAGAAAGQLLEVEAEPEPVSAARVALDAQSAVRHEAVQSDEVQSEAVQSDEVQSEAVQSDEVQSEAVQSQAFQSETLEVEIATPVILAAVLEPGLQEVLETVDEPAALPVVGTAAKIEDVSADAPPEPVLAAAPEPVAELEPVALSEPLRTGRWEPARQTSRPETAPWRDRRTAGPDSIYRAPERRFNWNTEAGKPLALVPQPIQEAPRPAPKLAEPASLPAPARLTRQWGLLSRFENPQVAGEGARELERNAGQASGNRGLRRG